MGALRFEGTKQHQVSASPLYIKRVLRIQLPLTMEARTPKPQAVGDHTSIMRSISLSLRTPESLMIGHESGLSGPL